MSLRLIDTIDDDGEAVIRIMYPNGDIRDYPYEDSGERADQAHNARWDAEHEIKTPGVSIIDEIDGV